MTSDDVKRIDLLFLKKDLKNKGKYVYLLLLFITTFV